jgi:hypothetical protein
VHLSAQLAHTRDEGAAADAPLQQPAVPPLEAFICQPAAVIADFAMGVANIAEPAVLLGHLQRACGFAPGELLLVGIESLPTLPPSAPAVWRIDDAVAGLLERGAIDRATLLRHAARCTDFDRARCAYF